MLLVDRRDVFLELDYLARKHAPAARLDRACFARWVAAGHLRAGRRRDAVRAYLRGSRAPGDVVRAAGAFLGPSVFAAASRARAVIPGGLGEGERVGARPDWLDDYARLARYSNRTSWSAKCPADANVGSIRGIRRGSEFWRTGS